LKRLVSAICILPPLALVVYYGAPVHFLLLVTIIVGLGLVEFYRMLSDKGFPCWKWLGSAAGMVLPLAFYLGGTASHVAVTAIIILMFIAGLFARQDLASALQSIAFTLLGIFYIGWLLSYVLLLRLFVDGPGIVFFVFGVVWLGDAAALVGGTLMGRHKLAPIISPRKTIEGAVGGVIGSLGGAIFAGPLLLASLTLVQCVLAGIILAILGQLGDLSESLVKRGSGIKDSGMLIPGHGGILDKVDGILFGAPAFYFFVLYVIGRELPS
jgi:phosphatidate cytidylyltransferase